MAFLLISCWADSGLGVQKRYDAAQDHGVAYHVPADERKDYQNPHLVGC